MCVLQFPFVLIINLVTMISLHLIEEFDHGGETAKKCSDEGLTLETSAFESLYGGQFSLSLNSADKTKLSAKK